jgi:hypothetical protein
MVLDKEKTIAIFHFGIGMERLLCPKLLVAHAALGGATVKRDYLGVSLAREGIGMHLTAIDRQARTAARPNDSNVSGATASSMPSTANMTVRRPSMLGGTMAASGASTTMSTWSIRRIATLFSRGEGRWSRLVGQEILP